MIIHSEIYIQNSNKWRNRLEDALQQSLSAEDEEDEDNENQLANIKYAYGLTKEDLLKIWNADLSTEMI